MKPTRFATMLLPTAACALTTLLAAQRVPTPAVPPRAPVPPSPATTPVPPVPPTPLTTFNRVHHPHTVSLPQINPAPFSSSSIEFERDGRQITIELRGRTVRAEVDGQPVPPERVDRDRSVVTVRAEDGSELAVISFGSFRFEWDSKLQEHKRRPTIGVQVAPVPESIAAHLDLEEGLGVLVEDVVGNGPAERAGIVRHDILVKLGDTRIDNSTSVGDALAEHEPGDQVEVGLVRKGRKTKVTVVLGERQAHSYRFFGPHSGPTTPATPTPTQPTSPSVRTRTFPRFVWPNGGRVAPRANWSFPDGLPGTNGGRSSGPPTRTAPHQPEVRAELEDLRQQILELKKLIQQRNAADRRNRTNRDM